MTKKKVAEKMVFKDWSEVSHPVLRPLAEGISHEKNITGSRVEFFKVFESSDDVIGPILPGGCLAVPNEMDMSSFKVTLANYTGDESTILMLASKAQVTWICGSSTIWHKSKISDGIYNSESKQFYFDVNSPIDGRPRKFVSNELFSVVLENLIPELWRRIRVSFNGTLYVPL